MSEKVLMGEIRINDKYAQNLSSIYDKYDGKGDSVPYTRKSLIETHRYVKKLSQALENPVNVLPPNCRYMEKVSKGTLVVIEEPPAFRTIQVSYSMDREISFIKSIGKMKEWGINEKEYVNVDYYRNPFKFTLAFPYVIFMMLFDHNNSLLSGQVYLRNARLSGLGDYLLKMPVMNISSDGFICYGDKARGRRAMSLNGAIEHTIMVFWSAIFNSDYEYNYKEYKDVAGVNTYIGWQALSRIDPMFIYSVDWINAGFNLGERIGETKSWHETTSQNSITYRELTDVFTKAQDTGIEEEIRPGNKHKQNLYYDIANGMYLDRTFYVHVGDPIMWGKNKAYIDSFIGFLSSDRIRYIRIQREDGKLIVIKSTLKVQDYIHKHAKQFRFSDKGVLGNGVEIKDGDIVILKQPNDKEVYKKVMNIRHSRDGVTEARIGNAFYILENTDAELFSLDNPEYSGIKLKEGEKYMLINQTRGGPIIYGDEVTYSKIDVTTSGMLSFKFKSTDPEYSETFSQTSGGYNDNTLITSYEHMPPIFFVGRKLFCVRKNRKITTDHTWKTSSGVIMGNNYHISTPNFDEIGDNLLTNDGATFHIESYNLSITFDIGDKVVCADWQTPMNMLMVKTITGFTLNASNTSLSFVLQDKNGNVSSVEYIKGPEASSSRSRGPNSRVKIIQTGKIRKITNEYNGVTAGTKIKATQGYIPHFPKKNTNIIIGFITDTGGDEPLVLCSNCCTLWFGDLEEKFKLIKMGSNAWDKNEHTPIDISKIKCQPGDIINGTSSNGVYSEYGYVATKSRPSSRMKMIPLHSYAHNVDTYSLDNYVKNRISLDCIPNPRVSAKEISSGNYINGHPNFHGLFTEVDNARIHFLQNGRSL